MTVPQGIRVRGAVWLLCAGLTATAAAGAQTARPAAAADPQVLEARAAYEAGRRAFEASDWGVALEQFERAYRIRPNPIVLLPISQCQEQLGRIPDSIRTLERYLADRPDSPDHNAQATHLAELRLRPATAHVVSTPTGAHVLLDGTDTRLVTPADVPVPPGQHTVRLERDGFTAASSAGNFGPGERVELTVTLAAAPVVQPVTPPPAPVTQPASSPAPTTVPVRSPAAPPAATTPPPRPIETNTASESGDTEPAPRRIPAGVWVATAIGVAGLGVGTAFGVLALQKVSDYDAMPTTATRDVGQTYALVADLCLAGAVLSGGVAAIVYLADQRAGSRRNATHVTPGANGFQVTF